MNITTEQIKTLRDKTGVSVMQCRKALEEAGGDIEKAQIILRKKSGELAAKKADRTFGAGSIAAYVHSNTNVGVMVELVCETDFVSKNAEFLTLARDIAMHITASRPKFTKREEVTESILSKAKEVFVTELNEKDGDKPEAVRAKILQGKLDSYYQDMVLMDQPFIKNPEVTIEGLIQAAIQKFGEKIEIARFVRFGVLEQ